MELRDVRATAEATARAAGAAAMAYWLMPKSEQTKMNQYDIVTAGDKASEAVIVPALTAAYPDHRIVSEEGAGADAGAEDAEYFWYIDPIDGTTNFAHNLPFFSVSIAMADRNMRPLVGVVYNPVADEMFSAHRGGGATLNGTPIHVTDTDNISACLLATGFPPMKEVAMAWNSTWTAMMFQARDVRRFGSAALDLAFVASGRLDGFWESHVHAWDVMAGLLLVEEAGGKLTDFEGAQGPQLYNGEAVIATNGPIHDIVLSVVQQRDQS
jgi:myo-inositol-1(or 4)-monophosphatase